MSGAAQNAEPGWIRRHRWSLPSAAVLLVIAVVVALSAGFFPALGDQPRITDVAAGSTAHYGGATIRLVSRHEYTGSRYDVPDGAVLVVATIAIDPRGRPAKGGSLCDAQLVQPTAAGERTWSSGYGGGTGYRAGLDAQLNCDFGRAPAYRMTALFLVPESARDAQLRFSAPDQDPQVLRLR